VAGLSALYGRFTVWRRQRREQKWRRGQEQRYAPSPFSLTYLVWFFIGLAAAAGLYWLLSHYLESSSANVDANFKVQLAQLALATVAGAGAAAGLYVAYRKQRNDEAGQLREQDRLFTERFSRAADQLGHDSAAVRLAGVYALGRIADDSPRDRDTCMRTLAAYLRIPFGADGAGSSGDGEVRRTALGVISERLDPNRPEKFWAAADLNLQGAQLDEIDFHDARIGSLTLSDARLENDANFKGTTFESDANFGCVTFCGQAIFDEAKFLGRANFAESKFSVAGASFVKVTFEGARVSFYQARFEGDANFGSAAFAGSSYYQKAFFGAYANFNRANFSAVAEFGSAAFDGFADFDEVTFGGYTCFQRTCFRGIRTTVNSHVTVSEGASFVGVIFTGDTDFMGVEFLAGGLFLNADCVNSSLQVQETSHIIYNSDTRWPLKWSDFTPPQQWIERTEDAFGRPGPAILFYTYSKDSHTAESPGEAVLAKRDEQAEMARRVVSKGITVIPLPADSGPEEYEEKHRLPSPNYYIFKGPSRSFGDIAPGPHPDSPDLDAN
jgi:uncharacterized protein YjbI with pentapeptide repeats